MKYIDSSTGKSIKSDVLVTANDAKYGTALGTDAATVTANAAAGSYALTNESSTTTAQ